MAHLCRGEPAELRCASISHDCPDTWKMLLLHDKNSDYRDLKLIEMEACSLSGAVYGRDYEMPPTPFSSSYSSPTPSSMRRSRREGYIGMLHSQTGRKRHAQHRYEGKQLQRFPMLIAIFRMGKD